MRTRRTLRAIRPSAALGAAYRRELCGLVDAMHMAVYKSVYSVYKAREQEITADASPARELADAVKKAIKPFENKETAQKMARKFATKAARHVQNAVKSAFTAAGLTKTMGVNFRLSRKEKEMMQSIIFVNVGLIQSIPMQYLLEVQGLVQRSVQNGRDIGWLAQQLEKRYGITRRRAIMIANDQNNKATQTFQRLRMLSMGITEGQWEHYPIGKTYREEHVEMSGKVFPLAEGMFDKHEGRRVQPGELVNCHCSFKAVIPDFKRS